VALELVTSINLTKTRQIGGFFIDFYSLVIYTNTMMQNILFTLSSIPSLSRDLYAYEREDQGGLC
jgi:hypothetical protein